jgi:glycerophosphoryl diester phosphodiesterase
MDFGKYIAHRGLWGENIPENSLSAFERAAQLGFAAELDVRLTKDCKMVVFHDENLERMCGVDGRLSDFTYEQLKAFSLGDTDEKIPLLKDVLIKVDGRVPLLIELKCCAPWGDLEKRAVRLLRGYKGKYAIESADPFSLLWLRLFAPKICRGQLISGYKSKPYAKYILRKICCQPVVWNVISKPDFVAADLRSVSVESLFAAIDIDADFITWTADRDDLMEAAQTFSKTVIFENYDRLEHDFSDNFSEEAE